MTQINATTSNSDCGFHQIEGTSLSSFRNLRREQIVETEKINDSEFNPIYFEELFNQNSFGKKLKEVLESGIRRGVFQEDSAKEIFLRLCIDSIIMGECHGWIRSVAWAKRLHPNKPLPETIKMMLDEKLTTSLLLQCSGTLKAELSSCEYLGKKIKKTNKEPLPTEEADKIHFIREMTQKFLEQPIKKQKLTLHPNLKRGSVNCLWDSLKTTTLDEKTEDIKELIQQLKQQEKDFLKDYRGTKEADQWYCIAPDCDCKDTIEGRFQEIRNLINRKDKNMEIQIRYEDIDGNNHVISLQRQNGIDYLIDQSRTLIQIDDWDKFWPYFEKNVLRTDNGESNSVLVIKLYT